VRLSFPPYISQRRALAFLDSKAEWVRSSQAKYAERATTPLSQEEIERLRKEAKATLPNRVRELAEQHGLRYGRVTIRCTRSKWGSCTAKGNLSLSLFLMTLPEHLRDYILLHELAHTVHLNHSREFHALVDQLTGGREKELAKELRKYSIR
jgi:predicted metal-dependent hydrolase